MGHFKQFSGDSSSIMKISQEMQEMSLGQSSNLFSKGPAMTSNTTIKNERYADLSGEVFDDHDEEAIHQVMDDEDEL